MTHPENKSDIESTATQAQFAWQTLDEQGRWLSPMSHVAKKVYQKHFGLHAELPLLIESTVFVHNASHLLDCLKAAKDSSPR